MTKNKKIKFKQRCIRCKKNMASMYSSRQTPICIDCEMRYVDSTVEDPLFKKLFSIPREYYLENYFLRSVRSNYAKYGSLSKNQIETFKKVVKDMKNSKVS